jgi:D-serine dehydratase
MLRITISALLFFSIVTANGQVSNQEASKKLSTFFRYVQLAYVDTVNGEELAEDAIRAIRRFQSLLEKGEY